VEKMRRFIIIIKIILLINLTIFYNNVFSIEDYKVGEVPFLPINMKTEDYANNCFSLLSDFAYKTTLVEGNGEPIKHRDEDRKSSFCWGVIYGIWVSEYYGHGKVGKYMNPNTKPNVCFNSMLGFEDFSKLLNEFIKSMREKTKDEKLIGILAAYNTMLEIRPCSNENEGNIVNLEHRFFFEKRNNLVSGDFEKSLVNIEKNNFIYKSEIDKIQTHYTLGVFDAINKFFMMEKNSNCTIRKDEELARMIINLMENKELFRSVSLVDNAYASVKSIAMTECKDRDNDLFTSEIEKNKEAPPVELFGKYNSTRALSMRIKWSKKGLGKEFSKGVESEKNYINELPTERFGYNMKIRVQSLMKMIKDINDEKIESENWGKLSAWLNRMCEDDPSDSKECLVMDLDK